MQGWSAPGVRTRKKAAVRLVERSRWADKLHWGRSCSAAAVTSVGVNQRYIFKKRSSNRTTKKQGCTLPGLQKRDQRLVGTQPCVSLRDIASVVTNSVFTGTL